MVEEYNLETGVLTKRAWKKSNILKSSKWDVEVGDALSECPEENIGLTESKDAVSDLIYQPNFDLPILNNFSIIYPKSLDWK